MANPPLVYNVIPGAEHIVPELVSNLKAPAVPAEQLLPVLPPTTAVPELILYIWPPDAINKCPDARMVNPRSVYIVTPVPNGALEYKVTGESPHIAYITLSTKKGPLYTVEDGTNTCPTNPTPPQLFVINMSYVEPGIRPVIT